MVTSNWNVSSPGFRRRAAVAMVALIGTVGAGPVWAAPEACSPAVTREVRVRLIDETRAMDEALEEAKLEAGQIWQQAGLRLAWVLEMPGQAPTTPRTVMVILRRKLTHPPAVIAASGKARMRQPLGWVVFDEHQQPGNLIEVSSESVASIVSRGKYMEFPTSAMTESMKARLLGRGLGRVIAHELGHWLMGRGHTDGGLMKPKFHADDLVDPRQPQLPPEWLAPDERSAAPAGCAPIVLRRLTE